MFTALRSNEEYIVITIYHADRYRLQVTVLKRNVADLLFIAIVTLYLSCLSNL